MSRCQNVIHFSMFIRWVLVYFCMLGYLYAQNQTDFASFSEFSSPLIADTVRSNSASVLIDLKTTRPAGGFRSLLSEPLHLRRITTCGGSFTYSTADSAIKPTHPFVNQSLTVSSHSEDSIRIYNPADPLGYAGSQFSMVPIKHAGPGFLKKTWFRTGVAALITGIAGYMFRKEADRAYASYLSANTPETMNHYFDRAVFYDKVSSGLYITCELNVCLAMWLSVRDSD